jgi:hypothetical protein
MPIVIAVVSFLRPTVGLPADRSITVVLSLPLQLLRIP